MDADIVEIPPLIHQLKKRKRAILHDVIVIDDGDDSEDLVIIGEKVSKSNKGKTIEAIHQVVDVSDYTFCQPGVENFGPAVLHDVIDIDGDDDSDDLLVVGEKVSKSNQGKTVEAIHQVVPGVENFGPVSGIERSGRVLDISLGVESSKSKRILKSFCSKMKSARYDSKNHGLAGNPKARKLLHADKPPVATNFKRAKKEAGSSSSYHADFKDEILRKFRSFKQFDTVSDASDHHFVHENSSMQQYPQNWAKVIQKEWKILEKCLPVEFVQYSFYEIAYSIFVRVYESRMDLLRAVIIGAEGTPYHNGLFFFDLYFPSGYPNVPPLVYFHSRGISVNPNLFCCGKVCLSLLNTFWGSKNERWLPGVSTILQVLVSIQGLILNTNPFFNTPGEEHRKDSAKGESLIYNNCAFHRSLWVMIYTMRSPPKNFEDFVVGHSISRAHDILGECNAYMEGAEVGSLVKGVVQDVGGGYKRCLWKYRTDIAEFMTRHLVGEFVKIGAKDCEKFHFAADKMWWKLHFEKFGKYCKKVS